LFWQAFAKLNPDLIPLLEGCQQNRDRWAMLAATNQLQASEGGKNGMKIEEDDGRKKCIDQSTESTQVPAGRWQRIWEFCKRLCTKRF